MTDEQFKKRLDEAKRYTEPKGKEELLLGLLKDVMSSKEDMCQIKRLKELERVNVELFDRGLASQFWLAMLRELGIPSTADDKPSMAAFSILHSRIMNELQWRQSMIKSDRAFTISLILCVLAMLSAAAAIISACK